VVRDRLELGMIALLLDLLHVAPVLCCVATGCRLINTELRLQHGLQCSGCAVCDDRAIILSVGGFVVVAFQEWVGGGARQDVSTGEPVLLVG
jgi:hypothetical protein